MAEIDGGDLIVFITIKVSSMSWQEISGPKVFLRL